MIEKILLIAIFYCISMNAQITDLELDTSDYTKEDYLENLLVEESPVDELFETPTERFGETIFSKPNIEIRSRFRKQLKKSKGYNENVYLGNPLYSYQRIRIGNKLAQGGILLKKDSGEKSYDDFKNYYFQLINFININKIILGDYIVEAGQGLMFWRGYHFAKGVGFTESVIKKGKELIAYNSSDELGFMRGFAAELDLKFLQFMAFYSSRNLTASIDTGGAIKNFFFTYFRTQSDLAKRNNTLENIYGFRIYKELENFKIGVTFSKNNYSRVIRKFKKNNISNFGIDILFNQKTINIAAESYLNNMQHLNSVFVLKLLPVKGMSYVFLYRNYSPYTFNRLSNPFGEYSNGNNEKGAFVGLNWKVNKYLLLSVYTDKYTMPFSEKYKKNGSEYFVQLNNSMFKNVVFYFRYRNKTFEDREKSIDSFNRIIFVNELFTKETFRLNMVYRFSKGVIYKFRVEYLILKSRYTNVIEYGRTFYHDINLNLAVRTLFNFRVTLFSTTSYQSGISSYENDLDGILTNPILYGKGLKWYFLFKYKMNNMISISIKYSYLLREDVKRIGSGWDQLPSNIDNRIGIQMEVNL